MRVFLGQGQREIPRTFLDCIQLDIVALTVAVDVCVDDLEIELG